MPNTEHRLTLPPFDLSIDLILVEGGEFMMGNDTSRYEEDKPAHRVRVDSFYLAKYPVTQAQWQAVMGVNPSRFKGEQRPVERVSWNDTQESLKKLNGSTGKNFRLPTEAEWEYAACGGRYSQGFEYSGSDKLKQVGWYSENSDAETRDVGLLLGNELGLHDMSGNVWEWCSDWFDAAYYKFCRQKGAVENPKGPDMGVQRVLRGGSYFFDDSICQPSYRYRNMPGRRNDFYGFRLALPLQSVG